MSTDDELAQTATAPATPSALAVPARTTLGRYRLEAVLGQGGMGVVHAAFDSELERKIALKVLRNAGSDDARARLLREARALAKLSHPHVITVFDVGSADGQDFVAMELVDGQTLGDWLHDSRPRWRQIVAAFLAAGRGLAAAHAVGLVHRDFKPSNVLRSRTGKIVVTDFGLARAAGGDAAVPMTARGAVTTTETGAIVGTPAYMAPEQWAGGEVTPATDQFAFCVALWEALAGERPYRGETIDELRTGVLGGPAQLAADAIPRPLRAMLRRGLAVDPAKRWPSMEALLAALDRHTHRRRRWLVAGALAAVAASVAAIVFLRQPAVAIGDCPPPAIDPAVAWSAQRASALAGRDAGTAKLVGHDLATWRSQRSQVCATPAAERAAKLACLDAALARLDAVVGSALVDHGRLDADGLASALVDPALCDRPSPPRLTAITPELATAFTLRRHAVVAEPALTAGELAFVDQATTPCARTIALSARVENIDERELPVNAGAVLRDTTAIADAAARCDDDPIKTEVAIGLAGLKGPAGLTAAEAAVAAFPQDDLRAAVEGMRGDRALAAEHWQDADAAFARAIELAGHRQRLRDQLSFVRSQIRGLRKRGRAEDITRAQQLFATWLPLARPLGRKQIRLEEDSLELRWELGDVAGVDAEVEALRARGLITDFTPPYPLGSATDVAGEVVDARGAPVANADVVAAPILIGDGVTITSPLYSTQRAQTRTDRDGKFTLSGARGYVVAQIGGARSAGVQSAAHVHLVVRPTSLLAGTVALAGQPTHRMWVVIKAEDAHTMLVAPILPDGTFRTNGVWRGKLAIGVAPIDTYEPGGHVQHLVVAGDQQTGIKLAVSQSALHIIARSADVTPPDGALIWLLAKFEPSPHQTLRALMGKHVLKSGLYAPAVDLGHVPKQVAGKVQSDDLFLTVPDRPDGELVACAIGFARQQLAGTSSIKDFGEAMADLEVRCAHVAADQTIVTIELPPLRKLKP